MLLFSETSDTSETNDTSETSENARKAAKKTALEAARGTSRETCKNVQRRAKEAGAKYIHFPFMFFFFLSKLTVLDNYFRLICRTYANFSTYPETPEAEDKPVVGYHNHSHFYYFDHHLE